MVTRSPSIIINHLIKKHKTSRAFARLINEDASDILRWRLGRTHIKARAVVAICKLHPEIKPYDLNGDIFPPDLRFTFEELKDDESSIDIG